MINFIRSILKNDIRFGIERNFDTQFLRKRRNQFHGPDENSPSERLRIETEGLNKIKEGFQPDKLKYF